MTVERFAISFDEQLARRVRRAAKSQASMSAWLADAAERKLRALGLQQIVREWEQEHGEISDAELTNIKKTRRSGPPRK
jgi:hypothetical protein